MLRNLVSATLIVLAFATAAPAKEWAQKMFTATSHDFGHVARGAKAEFAFEIQNQYEEDVHIVDVRTSCGCTTPTITKATLKTWEKGAILTTLNTKSFLGQRSSTLTVVIDKPFYAEVQLQIKGNIHGEVDFQPGSVALGDVDQGTEAAREITINYYGRAAWQITDVRSANSHLEVELGQPQRTTNGLAYKMAVTLKDDAPAGSVSDMLTLVTNDPRVPTVAIAVEGRVVPPLSISPSSLFLGVLQPGQKVTKQLVVTGKQPFKVTGVTCDDTAFEFKTTDVAKKVHLIPVTFTAGETAGELERTIEIQTDLASGGEAQCTARGTIRGAATTASTPESGRF
jgi:hypothetical protein